ncbi:MAG: hypothetical protein AAGM67_20455 [Bacteroidota bacterium]
MKANLYKSVLKSLSLMPEEYLVQVNAYLNKLNHKISQKEENRTEILALAGAWNDMTDADFQDFLENAKGAGSELFGREIEL